MYGPEISMNTFAFLDGRSTHSFIDSNFAKILGLCGRRFEINIKGIHGNNGSSTYNEKVNFELPGDDEKFSIKNPIVVYNLLFPTQTLSHELVSFIAKTQSIFFNLTKNRK